MLVAEPKGNWLPYEGPVLEILRNNHHNMSDEINYPTGLSLRDLGCLSPGLPLLGAKAVMEARRNDGGSQE
jgi:hypothetical protein